MITTPAPAPRAPRPRRAAHTAPSARVDSAFDGLRAQWAEQIGADQLEAMEASLAQLTGPAPLRFDTPGWFSRDLGAPA